MGTKESASKAMKASKSWDSSLCTHGSRFFEIFAVKMSDCSLRGGTLSEGAQNAGTCGRFPRPLLNEKSGKKYT